MGQPSTCLPESNLYVTTLLLERAHSISPILHVCLVVYFAPTDYTVKEGVNNMTQLVLVRSGDLSRDTVVTVTTTPGTATGIATQTRCISITNILFLI